MCIHRINHLKFIVLKLVKFISSNDEHWANVLFIYFRFIVLKLLISNFFNDLHLKNIPLIPVTFIVLKFEIFISKNISFIPFNNFKNNLNIQLLSKFQNFIWKKNYFYYKSFNNLHPSNI